MQFNLVTLLVLVLLLFLLFRGFSIGKAFGWE
ncbi:hypothetical protein AsAng_0008110 [Aureispira anguillae]|uniref:Uncharacterized protein n=1 Tax=Aureispira anguillae TaxID=2864201 RepID=A0A916DNT7_9BACT|nr:hypothetical protein AsAng_0008110 [Aureispira anguillae]